MVEALKKTLLANGGILFFYSLLAGLPYALVIYRRADADTVRDWSVVHDATITGALVLLVLGLLLDRLALSERQQSMLAWSFIVSFYLFAVSTTLEALFPSDELSALTGRIVALLSVLAAITGFVGGLLLLVGVLKRPRA